jgi:hypothetical protein
MFDSPQQPILIKIIKQSSNDKLIDDKNSFVQKFKFPIFMSKYVSKFRFECPSITSRTAQFIIINFLRFYE